MPDDFERKADYNLDWSSGSLTTQIAADDYSHSHHATTGWELNPIDGSGRIPLTHQ